MYRMRLNSLFAQTVCLTLLTAVGVTGCNQTPQPPAPLAEEQIPEELHKAFAKVKPEIKNLVEKLSSALQTKDYPKAFEAVQSLCSVPELDKDQRLLASRAMLTINGLLQAAQAQGDQNAAAAIDFQKKYK